MTAPKTAVDSERRIGLFGATAIGIGAIVGGGILALAGTAFQATGAGALVAFALNGVIAIVTALSFAELSTAFPQSGGTYVFAKRVLSVGAAFAVGWIVWFASIVAGALYAMGFAAFLTNGIAALLAATEGGGPRALTEQSTITATAIVATLVATAITARSTSGAGNLVNVIKVAVFAVLIGGGVYQWLAADPDAIPTLSPLLPNGVGGLVQAMGYTFIALQGFDLLAAVAGEVRDPRRVLPRAMLLSLGLALLVYLPILALVPIVGVGPGETVQELAERYPDTAIAQAAFRFLGPTGFWLVMAAGVLSMWSALQANVFAASRIAQSMARDRTLPAALEKVHPKLGTPVRALAATAGIATAILALVGDVAAAGAASSLIFLITFTLAHMLCVLTRRRLPKHNGFRMPWWPVLPIAGGLACAGLAVFQGIAVPSAGLIGGGWLLLGGIGYLRLFGARAKVFDAAHEASDPDLLELRGRSPLVLVPIANPRNAAVMAFLGGCMAPPRVGRVLLLNVIPAPRGEPAEELLARLDAATGVLRDSLAAAATARLRTEALASLALDPWTEIEGVANRHRCATLLLGMTELSDDALRGRLEVLASHMACNVVVFRAAPEWRPENVRRVLVPVNEHGAHNALRARALTSLQLRAAHDMHVVYLVLLPAGTGPAPCARAERAYAHLLRDEHCASAEVAVETTDHVSATILERAEGCDLLVLGLDRVNRRRRVFGETTRLVIAKAECAVMVISQRG